MSKFYFNGKEVNVGDTISRSKNSVTPMGNKVEVDIWELKDQETIDKLVKMNIIDKKDDGVSTDVNYYLLKIAEDLSLSEDHLKEIIDNMIDSGYIGSVISLLLKSISDEMDYNHPDYLEDYVSVYAFSLTNHNIIQIPSREIEDLNSAAFFRKKEEVELALIIISDFLEYL